ncbi:hypothetical protein Xbud_00837 [Xenorhabdus budapestensis]|uniref:Uncharacterized protein n=1 Tax=Xenorhabdus budapestensis TaxID=290110 RepID=A0A2D0J4H7_XENBU|nr:hypothetical protein Xbud_00837 [Xenorhabdus budapestensis]
MALFLFVKEENHNTGLFVVNMYFKRFFQLFSAFFSFFGLFLGKYSKFYRNKINKQG